VSDLHQSSPTAAHIERGKRGARRTAWMFAWIAVAVYAGFMLIVALGK
jgi:hypothetical protein